MRVGHSPGGHPTTSAPKHLGASGQALSVFALGSWHARWPGRCQTGGPEVQGGAWTLWALGAPPTLPASCRQSRWSWAGPRRRAGVSDEPQSRGQPGRSLLGDRARPSLSEQRAHPDRGRACPLVALRAACSGWTSGHRTRSPLVGTSFLCVEMPLALLLLVSWGLSNNDLKLKGFG